MNRSSHKTLKHCIITFNISLVDGIIQKQMIDNCKVWDMDPPGNTTNGGRKVYD